MSNPTNEMAPRAACAQMNRLIVACHDDAHAFGRAASVVIDPPARKRLLEQSRERRLAAEALSAQVRALGGRPAEFGSVRATVGTLFGMFRSALAGAHEGEAYTDCMLTERRTEKEYVRAARRHLPPTARGLVAEQSRAIAASCVELTHLRDQH